MVKNREPMLGRHLSEGLLSKWTHSDLMHFFFLVVHCRSTPTAMSSRLKMWGTGVPGDVTARRWGWCGR